MAGHMGDVRVTTQNLEVVADRQGARPRPGARRRARHQGRLGAGARRRQEAAAEGCAASPARSASRGRELAAAGAGSRPSTSGAEVMKAAVKTLDAAKRRRGRARRRDLRARAAHGPDPPHGALSAPQAHGRHPSRPGPLRGHRHRQEDVQAEGHRRRPPRRQVGAAVARRRQGVRAQAAQPRHRPAQEGARAGAEACALGQGQGRRDRGARQGGVRATARPRASRSVSASSSSPTRSSSTAPSIEPAFARAARNIPNIDVLPVQGINVYDILRRKSLVLTKAAVEALEARFK